MCYSARCTNKPPLKIAQIPPKLPRIGHQVVVFVGFVGLLPEVEQVNMILMIVKSPYFVGILNRAEMETGLALGVGEIADKQV